MRKILIGLWLCVFVLCALGVHGSSIAVDTGYWHMSDPLDGFVTAPLVRAAQSLGLPRERIRDFLLARPRAIRSDEHLVHTPFALAQAAHNPPFPIVNTNISFGQNMFTVSATNMPIWHITALARPSTWGYLLFGATFGLAWNWWFPLAACFTALALLLNIILKNRWQMALFGAFWFCASAYVVCWSFWPAYPTFFAALGLLAGYHLLSPSQKPSLFKSIFCGLLIGLSLAGFVMELYPPWLVALGYLALAVFIGLALRDKLFAQLKTKRVVFGALVAVFVAGVLLAFFAKDGASGLQPLANTDYPGLRVATGGDYPFTRFLRGVYDPLTIYTDPLPRLLNNQSATASFYLFFPAILMALVIGGKRLRSKMDAVDWALVIYLTAAMFYIFVGVPEFIARISLLSYLTSVRADIGIGLASILLSVSILNKAKDEPVLTRPALTSIAILVMALFAAHGLMLRRDAENIVPIWLVALASGLMALFSVALLAGRQRVFCFGLGGIVFFTTFFFHPLYQGLGPIAHSEVADQMRAIAATSPTKPVWASYGAGGDILAYAIGQRGASGVNVYPQWKLWQAIDPSGAQRKIYNRYSYVLLQYGLPDQPAQIKTPSADIVNLTISPSHPALREMGVTHVFASGAYFGLAMQDNLTLLYSSPKNNFAMFAVPLSSVWQTAPPDTTGQIGIACDHIGGWIWSPSQPTAPVDIEVVADGRVVTHARARLFDNDVKAAGIGDGSHALDLPYPPSLKDGAPHTIIIRSVGGAFQEAAPTPLTCAP